MPLTTKQSAPAGAHPFLQYLNRGEELQAIKPEIAFFCFKFVVEKLTPLRSQFASDPSFTPFILKCLDSAEACKNKTIQSRGSKPEMADYEFFIQEVFDAVDTEDRHGNINQTTVLKFFTCSIFIDMLAQFGELSEYWIERRKYSRFKAAYIKKCLAEGHTPEPGPPGSSSGDLDDDMFPSVPKDEIRMAPKEDSFSVPKDDFMSPVTPPLSASLSKPDSFMTPPPPPPSPPPQMNSLSGNLSMNAPPLSTTNSSNYGGVSPPPPLPASLPSTSNSFGSSNIPHPPTSSGLPVSSGGKIDVKSLMAAAKSKTAAENAIKSALGSIQFGDVQATKRFLQSALDSLKDL